MNHKIAMNRQISKASNPVSISWHNIDVFSKPSGGISLPFKKKKDNPTVHILKNVTGRANSGQLLAIMGSSGAGKTTLMNTLTQRNLSEVTVEGSVKMNGKPMDRNLMKSMSAYVQQDDVFIANITVREHLWFQSQLRMDQTLSKQFRDNRIEEVLLDLGLSKCADTRIGAPEVEKGISGGERKRLSFASELLTDPSVMFCDEPTSGLDSFMAMNIMEVMKDMASAGRTIICTIHQPSSQAFAMIDQLLLMAEGRVAFLGRAEKAIEYFASLDLVCPNNYNPADFYINQLAVIPGNEIETKKKITKICDGYKNSTYEREALPQEMHEKHDNLIFNNNSSNSGYKANWFKQFWALLWRSNLTAMREPLLTTVRIVQTIMMSLVFGAIYWQLNMDQKGIMDINGALFLLVTNMNFQSLFGVVNTFCGELPVYHREHENGMYRVSTYFLAKQLAEFPSFTFVPIIFVVIFYYMVGLNNGAEQVLLCILACVLVAHASTSFGYFVSCISSNVTMALSIAPPLMLPLMIFGGFFINTESTPVWLGWIKYISWFYYGNEALVINQWRDIDHIDCPAIPGANTSCIPNGKVVINNLSFNEDHFALDLFILLVLIVCIRVFAFIALLLKSRKR
ncbi:unnamed protein product [Medioppia subpectinata]|uniref:ABC transporter domain-containing protein n=1 Tax=Medioppia subpectinata TaxID=1979941 RepID=A0A7R9KJA5_9ACAR|nr:unnamed protein product [Medioppia subpectinata]CAG2104560.1 unnamed protein product [Medioppia subpectinata]